MDDEHCAWEKILKFYDFCARRREKFDECEMNLLWKKQEEEKRETQKKVKISIKNSFYWSKFVRKKSSRFSFTQRVEIRHQLGRTSYFSWKTPRFHADGSSWNVYAKLFFAWKILKIIFEFPSREQWKLSPTAETKKWSNFSMSKSIFPFSNLSKNVADTDPSEWIENMILAPETFGKSSHELNPFPFSLFLPHPNTFHNKTLVDSWKWKLLIWILFQLLQKWDYHGITTNSNNVFTFQHSQQPFL